ncbi:MAG: hypothetical protein PHY02_10805 [Phycisphaerae bacterium]|nr:hypothetical protein [Phycisphaerae bacterium]
MKLTITQFLRPDGRKIKGEIEIPDEYAPYIEKLKQCGCCITCEQLMTGEAVQYITCDEGDFDIIITGCGKAADNALFELLKRFDETKFQEWKKEQEEDTSVPII